MTKAGYAALVLLVLGVIPAYAQTSEPVLSFSGISSTGTQGNLLSFLGENFGSSQDIIVVVSDSSGKNIADMEFTSTKDGAINMVISVPNDAEDGQYKIMIYTETFSFEYNYQYDGKSIEFLSNFH